MKNLFIFSENRAIKVKRGKNFTKKVLYFDENISKYKNANYVICIIFIYLGSFKKGHSDKGHHVIHKGEEDEKKTKFFDEDGDEAHDEKDGNNKSNSIGFSF